METYRKLRWRQKRFVDFYVDSGNASEAMRRIGFQGKRPDVAGSKLVKKLRDAIDERKAIVAHAADLNSVEVISLIRETIDRCRQATPVYDKYGKPLLVTNADGELVAAYVFDAKNVLKGAELLGNHLKMFTQKHEVGGLGGGPLEHKHSGTIETSDPIEAAKRYHALMGGST